MSCVRRRSISKIREKSQREVEAIIATYRPPVSMRDRAKPVWVAVPTPSAPQLNEPRVATSASAGSEKTPNTAAAGVAGGPSQVSTVTRALLPSATQPSDHLPPSLAIGDTLPATPGVEGGTSSPPAHMERKFLVQFLASERFMKKFERAKALLSNKNGNPSYEAVLEAALDEFLKDHDPENRKQRREERNEKAEARTRSGERVARRNVRSQSACRICGAGWGQVDLDNLRLLCERHNKHEAERVLGANTVRRFRRRE